MECDKPAFEALRQQQNGGTRLSPAGDMQVQSRHGRRRIDMQVFHGFSSYRRGLDALKRRKSEIVDIFLFYSPKIPREGRAAWRHGMLDNEPVSAQRFHCRVTIDRPDAGKVGLIVTVSWPT
jgi:hypothetical protein